MKRILMMAVMALSLLAVRAQELTVNSISAAVFDATANSPATERKDLNGELCALIKVQLPLANAEFMGNIVGETVNHSGEYWVYVIDGTRQLHLHHGLIKPLVIYFPDFGIKGVEGGVTYIVDLSVPKELWGVAGEASSRKPLENFLVLRVTPANAKVFVGGSERTVSNGTCSIVLPAGTYPVRVEASGYQAEEFQVTIGDRKVERTVVLHSTMPTLTVTSATPGAEILINGTVAGIDRWEGALMPDTYVVELRKEGFRPSERRVTLLSAASETLEFPSMTPLTGELTVSSDPIGATVEFDGRPLGTTPDIFRDLPVGSHSVRLSLPGFQPCTSNVTISEATSASLNLTLSAQQESAATTVAGQGPVSTGLVSRNKYSHLDLAAERDGQYTYFSAREWNALSDAEKSTYRKIGIVVNQPSVTAPFILALNDNNKLLTWDEARTSGVNMPSRNEGIAIGQDGDKINLLMNEFGGTPFDGNHSWFWTKDPSYGNSVWVATIRSGGCGTANKMTRYMVRGVIPLNTAIVARDSQLTDKVMAPRNIYSHLDLMAERDGEYFCFSEARWKEMSSTERAGFKKLGIIINVPTITAPFVLSLTDNGKDVTYEEAMASGMKLPYRYQREAILSDAAGVTKALKTFGDDKKIYAFWTNEPYADGPWVILDQGFKFNKNQLVKLRIRQVEKVE